MTDVEEKNEQEPITQATGPVYNTVMDILRFVLATGVIAWLWMLLNVCPDCGEHHFGHGNLAPLVAGLIGATFFHILRIAGRKNPPKKS